MRDGDGVFGWWGLGTYIQMLCARGHGIKMSYYHYTNIESFYNIVQSGKVWFGSLAFMNDEMEGFELHRVLTDVLGIKFGEAKCTSVLELIDTTIDTFLRYQLSFSACTLKDDISQWRAYTQLGLGVCIEFEDGFIGKGIRKVKCEYEFDEKRRAIIRDGNLKVNDITVEKLLTSHEGRERFVNSIIDTLVSFKNPSFKPEQETRWVVSLSSANDKRIKFRPHRLGLTTYAEVPVDLSKVVSVTIGPQVPEQNLKTLEDFIILKECKGFVTKSMVTLR